MQRILRRLSISLSGTQLGTTVTSLVVGFIAEPTVADAIEPTIGHNAAIVLALVLVTVASMVIGELVPKNLSIARAERVSLAVARPITIYALVFGPVIGVLYRAANATVRRLGIEPQEELSGVRSLDELELLIHSSGEEGAIDEQAHTLLTRTLRFSDKVAADALVSRVEVVSVAPEDSISDLIATAVRTGFSRFPVSGPDLDDVVGVVHVKDVYTLPIDRRATEHVAAVMTEPFIVPESLGLNSLLVDLRRGSHLAIVVDEYGSATGIITLEDVVEELVGPIDDEYDVSPQLTKVLPAGTYELPGTLHLDDVRDACGFDIPEGDYETLAGFVLDQLGRIPDVGDRFEHEGWLIEVAAMDRRRVANVRLTAPSRVGRA